MSGCSKDWKKLKQECDQDYAWKSYIQSNAKHLQEVRLRWREQKSLLLGGKTGELRWQVRRHADAQTRQEEIPDSGEPDRREKNLINGSCETPPCHLAERRRK
jgi:hypothetical protein